MVGTRSPETRRALTGRLHDRVERGTLWNTRYTDDAVQQLREQGHPVREQDAARLSPLGHAHVNELGRYRFPMLAPGTGLRPLRDPHDDNGEET